MVQRGASVMCFRWRVGWRKRTPTQRGQSSTAGQGSIIGALMILVPRIMRGELDKLPKQYDGPHAGSDRRSRDLEELQRKLSSEEGIGREILCDFLHRIPGFTRHSVGDYLKVVKGGTVASALRYVAKEVMMGNLSPKGDRSRRISCRKTGN
jgi:hypothetical protein